MSAPAAAAPAAKKKAKLVVTALVCLACLAAGAVLPSVVEVPPVFAKSKEKEKPKAEGHAELPSVSVPFGEVVVNLAEERMTRYLRIKIDVLAGAEEAAEMTELLAKKKAEVKSKLISHLAGKTLKDVSGTVGVNRLQRELLEKFEDVLYPEGGGHVRGILFEEYVIQ